jgi:hypothetical protein
MIFEFASLWTDTKDTDSEGGRLGRPTTKIVLLI